MDETTAYRIDYARGVLEALGAPVTLESVEMLVGWMAREGTAAEWNPLATTQPAAGATDFNSVGVKNYPNRDVGIAATVRTIEYAPYRPIVAALLAGDGNAAAHQADAFHTWSGGGYDHVDLARLDPADVGGTVDPSQPEDDSMAADPQVLEALKEIRDSVNNVAQIAGDLRNDDTDPTTGVLHQLTEVVTDTHTAVRELLQILAELKSNTPGP